MKIHYNDEMIIMIVMHNRNGINEFVWFVIWNRNVHGKHEPKLNLSAKSETIFISNIILTIGMLWHNAIHMTMDDDDVDVYGDG